MSEPPIERRRVPFAVSTLAMIAVTVAVFRLPELFVEQLRRNRFLTSGQAGWVFRLLVTAAIGQAAYVGLALLRPERVERARREDRALEGIGRDELAASLARNAAGMSLLPLAYGLAAFLLTGERGGFWAFVAVAVAQSAWSYRQTGAIVRDLALQSGDRWIPRG